MRTSGLTVMSAVCLCLLFCLRRCVASSSFLGLRVCWHLRLHFGGFTRGVLLQEVDEGLFGGRLPALRQHFFWRAHHQHAPRFMSDMRSQRSTSFMK